MINTDHSTIIEIKAISQTLETLGKTQSIVKNGEAYFDAIKFRGEPSSKDNIFLITANSIDKQDLIDIFGQ